LAVFFETPFFTRLPADYLGDNGYRRLKKALLETPEKGDLIPGSGGFRKLRWQHPRRGKAKRGGLRIAKSGYSLFTTKTSWQTLALIKNGH
jgi:hypothetical protein